jgi:two-component system, NtrC family, response regulator AtoC
VSQRILIVDDEPKLAALLAETLAAPGRRIATAISAAAAWKDYQENGADLVITDLRMETEEAGLSLIEKVQAAGKGTVTILITAFGSIEAGVRALEFGASEYMVKPVRLQALRESVGKLLGEARQSDGDVAVKTEGDVADVFDKILIGNHRGMRRIYELLPRIVASDSNVLVSGESGTGKEVFARAIHEHGARKAKPFVRVNCAALVETLLEAELFGIEAGVATEVKARAGKFEQADGGTLFLDEIGDMAMGTQAKVLRVLQEREFERVGGAKTLKTDVRILAATHRDLEKMIAAGEFRQDLYYRINVIRLDLPPLRERLGDLEAYVRFFLQKLAPRSGRSIRGLTPTALEHLRRHSWPGNVRELENVIERSMILSTGDLIDASDLPSLEVAPQAGGAGANAFTLPEAGINLEELERSLLAQAMERSGGNKSAAARLLGLTRRTLGYRLEKHGLGNEVDDQPGD